jgi:lipoyl(octanoyl) transferase
MSLPTLQLWIDETPRFGPLNMALDEVMLAKAQSPWLRVYQWAEPSLSIGFSQALSKVPAEKSDWPLVRRWTGGGVVVHDGDWTYTLAVPASVPLSDAKAVETYRWVHECLIAALEASGEQGLELQADNTSDGMGVCFVEPAKFDVVWQGRKIAGAAQRRSKQGLLHQGTLQEIPVRAGLAQSFANQLATEVLPVIQAEAEALLLESAKKLAQEKYATEAWRLHRTVPKP